MFDLSKFFLGKIDSCGKNNIDIFENSIHFQIPIIVLKNETSLPSGGAFAPPRTLCGGSVVGFMWPGRPPKKLLATPLAYCHLKQKHFLMLIKF